MKKTIPAREVIVCDRCSEICGIDAEYKREVFVRVTGNGLDLLGDPACPDNREYHLCDHCAERFEDYMKKFVQMIDK